MNIQKQKGFTIVELLIVIVVIGILAAIVIIAYNGVASRAKDAQRRNDVENYAKAVASYQATTTPQLQDSNCGFPIGSLTGGSGWIADNGGSPTIAQCLVNAKLLNAIIKDPSGYPSCTGNNNPAGCRAYGMATCNINGAIRIAIYAQMDSPSRNDSMNDVCSTGWASLGFNYTKVVQ